MAGHQPRPSMADYRYSDLSGAMAHLGIAKNDIVVMHSSVANFGIPEGALDRKAIVNGIFDAVLKVVGEGGTIVFPTFSYSFGSDKANKYFDPSATPSVCGVLTEYARSCPESRRSCEPMLSVAAVGADAEALTADVSNRCLGSGSVWPRLMQKRAKICNLNLDPGSTFIHYIESELRMPYRFDIPMNGVCVLNGNPAPYSVIYSGRDLSNPKSVTSRKRYFELAYERGLARKAKIGKGFISTVTFEKTYEFLRSALRDDPWFLTVAGCRK